MRGQQCKDGRRCPKRHSFSDTFATLLSGGRRPIFQGQFAPPFLDTLHFGHRWAFLFPSEVFLSEVPLYGIYRKNRVSSLPAVPFRTRARNALRTDASRTGIRRKEHALASRAAHALGVLEVLSASGLSATGGGGARTGDRLSRRLLGFGSSTGARRPAAAGAPSLPEKHSRLPRRRELLGGGGTASPPKRCARLRSREVTRPTSSTSPSRLSSRSGSSCRPSRRSIGSPAVSGGKCTKRSMPASQGPSPRRSGSASIHFWRFGLRRRLPTLRG